VAKCLLLARSGLRALVSRTSALEGKADAGRHGDLRPLPTQSGPFRRVSPPVPQAILSPAIRLAYAIERACLSLAREHARLQLWTWTTKGSLDIRYWYLRQERPGIVARCPSVGHTHWQAGSRSHSRL